MFRTISELCLFLALCGLFCGASPQSDRNKQVQRINSHWFFYEEATHCWSWYDEPAKEWRVMPRIRLTCWHGSWCRWCPQLYPTVDRLISEGWPIVYTDTDDPAFQSFQAAWNISSVPTCVAYTDDGQEYKRLAGVVSREQLLELMQGAGIKPGKPGEPPKHETCKANTRCPEGSCPGGSCPR